MHVISPLFFFSPPLHNHAIAPGREMKFQASNPSAIYRARQMFDSIPQPDPHLANAIISAFTKLSLHRETLRTFLLAHRKDTPILHFSIPPALKSCASLPATVEGLQLHSLVVTRGFYSNAFVQTSLIDFYAKTADLHSARKVFDEIVIKEVVPYNSMIYGYSKSGNVLEARRLFDEMPCRTHASWNSMISCYAHEGDLSEAFKLFEQMQAERFRPNDRILVTILSVCAKSGNLDMGLKVREMIDRLDSRDNMIVRTAVLEMYVKCGFVDEARMEFDRMDRRDVVTWSAMIAGYAQNGRSDEALELFERMRSENCEPNEVTLVSVLSACGQLGSVEVGESIGSYVESRQLASGVHVGSALLDMYAKCGNIKRACWVFDEMKQRDVVSWNSMIGGLAINGLAEDAIKLYCRMLKEGLKPNDLTFTGLLSACTHAGLVDRGLKFFESMKRDYGVVPKIEHCSCIVDLFCRLGRLDDAYKFICHMEVEPNFVIWSTLLTACRVHTNVELAERLVEKLSVLDPGNSSNYVLLSSLYASLGRWDEAREVRVLMTRLNVTKVAAYSWIELDDSVHKFLVGDTSHPRSDEIYDVVIGLDLQLKSACQTRNFDMQPP